MLKKVQKKRYIYRNTGIILQILLWSYRMCNLLPSIYIKVTILVWAWACNKTLHVSLPKKLCDLKNWVLLPKRQCDRCTHENETLKKLQLSVLREACHTYKMRCRRRLYVTNWASSEHLCQDSKPSQQSCVDNYTHTHTHSVCTHVQNYHVLSFLCSSTLNPLSKDTRYGECRGDAYIFGEYICVKYLYMKWPALELTDVRE